ncbi:hypothetical protein QQ045_029507 [Rhodiola kirilowii]
MTFDASKFLMPCILKFVGDYGHWSMLMNKDRSIEEFWNVVEFGVPEVNESVIATRRKTIEDLNLKDLKEKNYLFPSIHKSILKIITKRAQQNGYTVL